MRDRTAFLKPIAHRGLHNAARGIIENTVPAFEAAIARGYGIECDLRPARDGTPMVFHDLTLERLIDGDGAVAARSADELKALRYRTCAGASSVITLADLLALVADRVPLLIEIKSEWDAPDAAFLRAITEQVSAYRGAAALMSFDPAVMTAARALAPDIPRGIVAGQFVGECWWRDKLGAARAHDLTHLLESGPAAPDFYAYDVNALPTNVTRFVREVANIPLFTWTVRTEEQRATAAQWADAPIFEGYEP
ncbi:Glycerophosphoryl diester phosphodiesterase [Hyphomicrobium sulfonivorans]|uniref:Glycerophosphoryl diester phosphodiesterase n=1 Tax=Hyphomicrobium sulfonivorans TaxID=121290 RepID=A0A120CX82_HYPSL|nr:glycerophosphodiester phosphodiesterase family protein [Hyphomicrobium sulfonivorans]KWT70530.1 Glycerophosphoryl diester phosphodiesterase [Hyphomicrobium sulfonivorans]